MASTTPHQLALLLFVLSFPPAMSVCFEEKFPSGRSYATCDDLHALGAALHWNWTHDGASGSPSLSLAFVAAPAKPGGWVAWGINPTGTGMVGAQVLLALAGGATTSSSSPAVRTYNITGYSPLGANSTPIVFPATDLAADVSGGGKVRLYATLKLEKGMAVVNHVWQVGSSVTRGAPVVHAMDAENLSAMANIDLSDGAVPSPPAPAGGASSSGDGNGDWSPSPPPLGGSVSQSVDTARVSVPALVVLALLGFLVG